ncbi:DUF3169 family protein [Oceanobacillus sp. 1P07AA]|uniref:DUF3169 family protein n=1 Tax=Oceanobacillus sp. 1P07AA TaxID=3132293 RepID=UPI0039A5BC05
MKSVIKLFSGGLVGAIVGYFVMYFLMNFSEFNFAGIITVISLLVVSSILIVLSLYRFKKIKFLNKQQFSGDEEDEIEDKKYKLFADYSLYTNISFILSVLALSLSIISTKNVFLTTIAIILIIVSLVLSFYMTHIMKQTYPNREINTDYTQSVLDMTDDGEKQVILDGLYQSHSLLNFLLVFAIFLATVYSIFNESQIFSIFLMTIGLLLVNGYYLLTVRNK